MRFYLDKHQQLELLYYETGFEQLHPIPPIYDWMEERGWEYYKDWHFYLFNLIDFYVKV
jgi:hypothetical protein